MRGAATFLASPWGGGSDAARRPSALCAATTQHNTHTDSTHTHTYPGSMATLDHPWGAAPHWCGLGLPAARAATREKAKR